MDENDLKNILIKEEYEKISKILYEIENKVSDNSKILLYSRANASKMLNKILIKLNNEYINKIKKLSNEEEDLLSCSLYTKLDDNMDSENSSSVSMSLDNSLSEDVSSHDSTNNSENDSYSSEESNNSSDNTSYNNLQVSKKINKKVHNNLISLESEKIDINKYIKKNKDMEALKKKNKVYLEEIREEKIKSIEGSKTKNKNYTKYVNYDGLKSIRNDIILLCKIIGFMNIEDIFFLEEGIKDYKPSNIKYNLIESVFVPLDFTKEKKTKNNKTSINTIKKIKSKHVTLINNCCEICIPCKNNILRITGYVRADSLNVLIRTCEISNIYLLEKKNKIKKKIIEMSDNMQNKNKQTILNFYKNMTTEDIILLDEDNMEEYLSKILKIYNEVTVFSFPKLIKFFTKDVDENLENIFLTIKLLLLGDDENLSMANLLFNLLKHKKTEGINISDIVYEKLNYSNQIKLKRSKIIIQEKLEKLKEISVRDIDIKKQISVSKNIPQYIKKICLEKLEETKSSNNETGKIKMYVDYLMKFPWPTDADDLLFKEISSDNTKSKEFLENVKSKLDKNVYGHKKGKDKIIQIMGKLISSQGTNISPMALYGPPGVGKTRFAQSLADCLNMPFIQITLGGQNDGELLHGHGYTYSSAQPGLIIKKLTNVDSSRCIMYFDELDKCVSKNGRVNEVMSILTHLIDPMTNGSFQDRFFQEVTFPLNKIFFIFSFNDASEIDSALLNRMEKINIDPYTTLDKVKISKNYLLEDLFKEIGLSSDKYEFSEEILINIIENYTREPGVRSLKRALESILLKLNVNRILEEKLFDDKKTKITVEIVREILGEEFAVQKLIPENNMIGCVNGLYCTDHGEGGIIPIQIDENHLGQTGKFSLSLTGNQKKIMKESVNSSYNVAVSMLSDKQKSIFFKKYPNGLQIHALDASTPKEGPSAGCAFTLGFMSVMLNLKIKNDVAMTGEIDLNGKVKAIGGLKYKIQGGFKSGVNTIFVPLENERDIKKIVNDYEEIFEDTKIYTNNFEEIDTNTFKKKSENSSTKKINKKTNKKNITKNAFNDDGKKIIFYDQINDLLKFSLINYDDNTHLLSN
jgi:ATP-dependent Lon protease